ncbi:penicillin-binding protein 2 [Chitinivorax sp. PXF-14]|uniref:peptidoglycan D,D-transpeptidase FtsI family protein n=1 Tax=Chitinivorax sp. PXF-14 TaxID=3230488 RepID=UPI003467C39F
MYTANSNLNARLPAWRSYTLMGALGAGFALLVGRAVYLQAYNREFLQEKGEARYSRVLKLEAIRGMITDRNGEPLAISTPVQSIWASPADMDEMPSQQQIGQLAKLLGMTAADVTAKIADRKRDFVFIKRQIQPELADRVLALNIPGIYKQQEYRRYYPAGEFLAHIIGQTGIDDKGQEGMELTRNATLAGKPGSRHVIRDRRGYIVEDVSSVVKPQDGQTLTLSIDRNLQYLAYRELKQAVDVNKAKAGGLVMLDAKTGEVLALANIPSYNPNNRGAIDPARKRNRALTDLYEPGSTMKPITAAAALEAGTFKPTTIIDTQGGRMSIGPATIHDAHPHGALTVEQVIQVSSNVGAAKMALSLGHEYHSDFLHSLGFGQVPHTGFPGEAAGRVRPWKTWRPIEQATMSYGHGISVSLIQMAHAYMVFANHGEIKPISFIKQVAPPPGKQVIKPETADAVKKMLEMVTQPGGTATRAQVVGYRVGGKTGTANKLEGGGYSKNKYVSSFVGLAPASDPRLIVAVMIDEATAGQYYGGTVAAPVFANVMGGALRILGVPNDAPVNSIILPGMDQQEAAEGTM